MLVWFTMGKAFWYVWIWLVGRAISQYCRVCSNVLRTCLDVADVGIFAYGWGFLVHLKMVDCKNHFSKLQGLLESLNNSFRFWLFLQSFDVFKLLEQNWGFLSNFHVFHYGQDPLVHLNLVGWKTHFSLCRIALFF